MLAGGVGITPLMSMIRFLTDRGWPGKIHLIYSNKTEGDIIFRRELEELAGRFANLNVVMTLTRAEKSWTGAMGRIEAALLRRLLPEISRLPVYLCGPNEMLHATRETLRGLGVAEGNIHTESFGIPRAAMSAGSASAVTFNVTFSKSGRMSPIASDQVILEVAEDLGIGADFECRAGICGTCKCRMLSGAVVMETQDALDEGDRENGMILLCQARATEDVVVEL